eukprot:jgi/Astpho2/8960/Aster-02638
MARLTLWSQVTGIAVLPSGDIISTSLDKTVRFWHGGACVQTLEGHSDAVQCLLLLPDGRLLTGSNDRSIKLWEQHKCVHTFQGHTDTVRLLVPLAGLTNSTPIDVCMEPSTKPQLAGSSLFDGPLAVWEVLSELVGHTEIIYNVACSSVEGCSMIATASEDNTVKLWQADGQCLQTIEHPACVFAVAFMPNGDLVTACSDGVARIFSKASERQAPAETVAAFHTSIEDRKQQAKQAAANEGVPPGLNVEEPSALAQPGRDGQMKFIRESTGVNYYSWSSQTSTWQLEGQVTGASDNNMDMGRKTHGGQEWDYVFDVDVEEGQPPLKMPCNKDENPYAVAESVDKAPCGLGDRFIANHNLPASYQQQIVEFVIANTGGSRAAHHTTTNVDPFTETTRPLALSEAELGGQLDGLLL